jgi:hypothetical protein
MKIKFRGEEVEVLYYKYGKYIPPTRENPAEYPDIDITKIIYKEVDIGPILSDTDLELIYEILIEKLYD